MRKRNGMIKMAFVLLFVLALYWSNYYVVYMMTYIFSFLFLFFSVILLQTELLKKVLQIVIYGVILAAQIVADVLLIRHLLGMNGMNPLGRLLGIVVAAVPFLVRQSFLSWEYEEENERKRITG